MHGLCVVSLSSVLKCAVYDLDLIANVDHLSVFLFSEPSVGVVV
jgi:hypothetical protein